jgi:ligand-binding sensor domain-containing protein/serine phosphatase RsbU (regulator of sigma subunit)
MTLIVFQTGLPAKKRPISFEHISLNEGLSQATVYSILQDQRGFMWFATQDGLNKYDGYSFKVYRTDDDNPNSLSHIYINTLFEDHEGMLWIGTNGGGLNRLDPETEIFTRFTINPDDSGSPDNNFVNVIFEDRSNNLWVGSANGGLNKLNRETGTFTRYLSQPENPDTLRDNTVTAIYQGTTGRLWVGTRKAWLHKLDPKTGRFTAYHIPGKNGETTDAPVIRALYEENPNRLWVGTEGGGLHILDPETGTFTRSFFYSPDNPSGLSSNAVTSVIKTHEGALLIGTQGGGLDRFTGVGDTFDVYKNDRDEPDSLDNDYILSLYEDRSGLVWIGTFSGGINRFKCGTAKFNLYRKDPGDPHSLSDNIIRAFTEDRSGRLWVGTLNNGLNRFDVNRETVTTYTNDPSSPAGLSSNSIRVILTDRKGTVWVGTADGGLDRFNSTSGTFTRYIHDENDPLSLSFDSIVSLFEARNGVLWIGTWGGGLNRFNPKDETFTHYLDTREKDPHVYSNRFIYTIYEDRNGTFWLGTNKGLTRFSRKTGAFACYCGDPDAPYSLANFLVTSIYEDNTGLLWFGTVGGGLNRFDPVTGEFRVFKEKNGLPNNVIYGILGDDEGNPWFSSNRGLTKFDRKAETCRNYDVYDGLQSSEFNGGAYFKNKKGEMFFGGVNGFNSFFPAQVKDNPYIPPVVITDFKIFNKSVPIRDKRKPIELAPDQNVFSFDFVSLNFLSSHKNRYAYKMEGFDKDWVYVGRRRYASYTNLNHGEYVFRVKASNNDGIWNEEGTSVRVIVHPTFWETGWAYIIYLVLLFGIFYVIRWIELTRERARVRIRESELRARAAEAQARAIQAENLRQNMELEEARKLQLSMLPHDLPDLPFLDIAVHMETATEVGGDYYDFHVDDDGTLAVAVGDATGHGLKAGTMVSVIKGLFCSEYTHLDIDSFFHKCTHTIRHMRLGNLYMALTLMSIRGTNVHISSAGMPPLLVYRPAAGTMETVFLKGTPLGAFPNVLYKSNEFELGEGDTMLLFSDGLPELFNRQGEMFGYDRVARLFEEVGHRSPREIILHLKEAGDHWLEGKSADDDITFVVIKFKNNSDR